MTPMPFAAPIARALLRSQADERLVTLAREGHKGAFDEIVRRYRAPLVAFATAYATSEKAEDVVQDSLTNAWVSLQGSDRDIAVKPWLYAIVRNRALNARRDARFHEPLDETIDGVRRPEEIVLERDELSRTVAAVAALPEGQRRALIDSAIEGRTHDQIAAELGTTPGSVRGMIHRGRVAVRTAAGSIVPLPLVAWAGGTGGATAGGIATGSVAGGSLAAKGAAVAAIAVLATGSGVVVERSLDDSSKADREASAQDGRDEGRRGSTGANDANNPSARGSDGPRGSDDNRGPGEDSRTDEMGDDARLGDGGDGGGDDDSGPGGNEDDDDSGHSRGDDDNSGPGGGEDDEDSGSDEDNGHDDSGSGRSGSGSDDEDSSGSGSGSDDDSSGSGSDDSDSSDSGPLGSGSDDHVDLKDD